MNTDTKKYRLLKDLPDAKIGTEFIEDNDDNCYNYTSIHGEGCWYNKHYIENNPEWFEEVLPEQSKSILNKQEGRIEVVFDEFGTDESFQKYGKGYYGFITSKEISEDKFPAIKEAIEDILNEPTDGIPLPKDYIDTSKTELYVTDGKGNKFPLSDLYHMKYTQHEVDTIREETWKASRETTYTYVGEPEFPDNKIKYKSFSDYLQTIPKNKPTSTKEQGKGWEILKCRNNSMGVHDFVPKGSSPTPCLKEYKPCEIYSVRRNSDGEVFTVGDDGYKNGRGGKIKAFHIEGKTMVVTIDDGIGSQTSIANLLKNQQSSTQNKSS